jgi:putative ABC transport system permease protein
VKWFVFAWKNVLRNRRRALAGVLISAIGTAAVLIGGGFALYTYESLRELTARDTGHVVVAERNYFSDDEDTPMQNGLADAHAITSRLATLPNVHAVVPRVHFSGLISNGDKSTVFVGSGVAPDREFELRGPQMSFVTGQPLDADADATQVLIGVDLARVMKAKAGTLLTLLTTTAGGALNAVDVIVHGVVTVAVPEVDKRLVLAPIGTVQKLLDTQKVSTLSVYTHNTDESDRVAAQIRAEHPQLDVRTWLDLAVFYRSVRALYNRIFGMLGVVMLVVVLFTVTHSLSMAVLERTREIGTLRAIGTLRREIVRNFVLEGTLIGSAGALAGMLLAAAVTVFLSFAGLQMPAPPGRSIGYPLYVNFSAGLYALTALIVIALSAGAAWVVSARAGRKPITDALGHV